MIIKYGRQTLDENDVKSVTKILERDFLTQGPQVNNYENKLKEKFGSKYCAVVSNGTAALHLAVKSLSLPKNSKIVTTPMTFVATSNSIIMNNLRPEFVDIEISWEGTGLSEVGKDASSDKILVKVSKEFFRPSEVDLLLADPTKANKILGWTAKTEFKELICSMVEYDLNSIQS